MLPPCSRSKNNVCAQSGIELAPVVWTPKFCMVVPNICWFSMRILLHGTFLVSRIFRWRLDFWKTFAPPSSAVFFSHILFPHQSLLPSIFCNLLEYYPVLSTFRENCSWCVCVHRSCSSRFSTH